MALSRGDVLGIGAVAALTLGAAAVGGATGDFRSRWYRDLNKPAWQPSGRTIGAVWSILYPTIAVAGGLLWTRRDRPGAGRAGALFVGQLILNAAWTPLFTRAHRLRLATAECGTLAGVNTLLVGEAWRVAPAAALLLVPYTLWTLFATFLSGSVARLNP